MSKVDWSKAQKKQRRLAEAHEIAKAAMADPQVCAMDEKKVAQHQRQLYRGATSD